MAKMIHFLAPPQEIVVVRFRAQEPEGEPAESSGDPAEPVLEQWALVLTAAGLFSDGTRGDLLTYRSVGDDEPELLASDLVSLSKPEARTAYSASAAEMMGVTPDEVAAVLLKLKDKGEVEMRKAAGERPPSSQEESPGMFRSIMADPDIADDEVDGAGLFFTLVRILKERVVLPGGGYEAIALWIIHTYTFEVCSVSPILLFTSPLMRCGKSSALTLTKALSYRGLVISNTTAPALFRCIEEWRPSLFLDEADTFLRRNEELRGVINAGHMKSTAYVIRCVGDSNKVEEFSTWSPKAVASIGKHHVTLMDRSIEISMRRATPEQKRALLAINHLDSDPFPDLRGMLLRWATDHKDEIVKQQPARLSGLDDREADNWTHLLQIAAVLGPEILVQAQAAAQALSGMKDDDEEHSSILLLGDMRAKFRQESVPYYSSEELVKYLHSLENRPWTEWGRALKPISKVQVAGKLKPFGIVSHKYRPGGKAAPVNGYVYELCVDAFARYLEEKADDQPDDDPPTQGGQPSGDVPTAPESPPATFSAAPPPQLGTSEQTLYSLTLDVPSGENQVGTQVGTTDDVPSEIPHVPTWVPTQRSSNVNVFYCCSDVPSEMVGAAEKTSEEISSEQVRAAGLIGRILFARMWLEIQDGFVVPMPLERAKTHPDIDEGVFEQQAALTALMRDAWVMGAFAAGAGARGTTQAAVEHFLSDSCEPGGVLSGRALSYRFYEWAYAMGYPLPTLEQLYSEVDRHFTRAPTLSGSGEVSFRPGSVVMWNGVRVRKEVVACSDVN